MFKSTPAVTSVMPLSASTEQFQMRLLAATAIA
jgi:hypothetical protein